VDAARGERLGQDVANQLDHPRAAKTRRDAKPLRLLHDAAARVAWVKRSATHGLPDRSKAQDRFIPSGAAKEDRRKKAVLF